MFLLITLAILFACYQFLGLKLTLVVALLLFVLGAICSLILRVKNKIRRKKIISLFMIFFLTLGIIALSCFCAFMVYVKSKADPKYENAKLNPVIVTPSVLGLEG